MLENKMIIPVFYIGLLLFLFPQNISAKNIVKKKDIEKDNVMCIAMPKSGTDLLLKCITLIGAKNISYNYLEQPKTSRIINLQKPLKQSRVRAYTKNGTKAFAFHFLYTPDAQDVLKKYTYANFFMIRDPRAHLVSQAFDFEKKEIGGKKSLEEIMIDMIKPSKQYTQKRMIIPIEDLFLDIGMHEFYKLFLPWMNAEKFYTVRFENLVGPQGGGNIESQYKEIKNIAQHLGVNRTEQEIKDIAKNLFGNAYTFREGKIDSWKQYFTPKVKEAFKANMGLMQMLIDLGYEKDISW